MIRANMSKIDRLSEELDRFESLIGDLEAALDDAGKQAPHLDKSDKALCILKAGEALRRVDQFRKVLNRNLAPLKYQMAREMILGDESKVQMHGHSFSVGSKSHFTPPSKTKRPEEWDELIRWLSDPENRTVIPERGADPILLENPIQEVVTVKIEGSSLAEFCQARLDAAQPLPPHVGEYSEFTVSVRKVKGKCTK